MHTPQAVIGTDVAELLLADDMESEQPPQIPTVKFLVGDTPRYMGDIFCTLFSDGTD